MAEPMSTLSPEKLNAASNAIPNDDDIDMTWHDPPSSPFVSHIETDEQENIAPATAVAPTPVKLLVDLDNNTPQSAFKISPQKFGLKDRTSLVNMSPTKQPEDDLGELSLNSSAGSRASPRKASPIKQATMERPESAMSNRSRKNKSPSRTSRDPSAESTQRFPVVFHDSVPEVLPTPSKRPSSSHHEPSLRENEGLTVAMRIMEETRSESHELFTTHRSHTPAADSDDTGIEESEFNPDGPELTSLDVDDTCFSNFSEMPGLDMTKFALMRKSPTKNGLFDQATPRARPQMTPSTARTVRRADRTPSPTPRPSRKENDTTNLLLDFTAQFEAFSSSRRGSPTRARHSPTKSTTEPNLLSFYHNQRSPAKRGATHVPATPGQNRQLLNLLDFELPPPPTPRSVPTVTIRELESLKSTFQSQISSLSASLSGKEAQVESLVQAVSDAERRVGEAQESLRDQRSAREYAESQMADWKKKGEEVQSLLQDVQSEMARNDSEREQLLARLSEAEKRAEEAETRSSDLETKLIEAESKNVDMTTLVNPDEDGRKIYSEAECTTAIAEKVNEVARDLHAAYKAKHEKKIKALKDNYQKKADERCKELRVQIIRLERQVEEAEKKRDNTFSAVIPTEFSAKTDGAKDGAASTSTPDDLKLIESQKLEIENLKAKLAGLQSELSSLRKSHDNLLQDLEAERVEKGELVAAAEQMLAMCGEKMEEMQQEEFRKSQIGGAPPTAPPAEHLGAMRGTGLGSGPTRPGSALGSARPGSALGERSTGIARPTGLRAPGGFGYQGGAPGLSRSTSGGKSRLMSNIERMGGAKAQE